MVKRYEDTDDFKPTRLVAGIVEQIDRMIAEGELVSGQRLIETDLAAALGVGRAPLREAIRILVGDGVLDLIPNRGARVKQVGPKEIAEMLKVATTLTFMGLDEFVEQKNFPAALRRLETLNDKIGAALASFDTRALYDAMWAYGNAIARSADNLYLLHMLARIHLSHHQRLVATMLSFADIARAAAIYEGITAALRRRDADEAHRIVRAGVRNYAAAIKSSQKKTKKIS